VSKQDRESAIVESCCFKPRYSGDESRKFWGEIGKVQDDDLTLYAFACALQDIEGRLLRVLNEHVREDARRAIGAWNKPAAQRRGKR